MLSPDAPPPDEIRTTEPKPVFERRLPGRLGGLARRIQRQSAGGWDINGLYMLRHDAAWLADASERHGLTAIAAQLHAIEGLLRVSLDGSTLPGPDHARQLLQALDSLRLQLPQAPAETARPAPTVGDASRVEAPPPGYWRRWAEDAPPATPVAASAAPAGATPAPDAPPAAAKAPARRAKSSRRPAPPPGDDARHVLHLTDASALSEELDQRLASNGFAVEVFGDAETLRDRLADELPRLVLVDATHTEELESIGAVLRASRQRSGVKSPLAAIAAEDDLGIRLAARRAGADALIIAPPGAGEVLRQLQALLEPVEEAPYRILVVEDDRSQGLFAESILRNAGMQVRVVDDPFAVLPAMEEFEPDLLLMDLHMPRCNGMELTALIRERERFAYTPIVFLSGEGDQDLQFEALDAGGDDFLAKPVRPRHLISSVQNRVRRARALARRQQAHRPSLEAAATATALQDRHHLIATIATALAVARAADTQPRGGVLFIDIESGPRLREQFGLSALDRLMAEAGQYLASRLGEGIATARFGDASFAAFAPEHDEAGLRSLAQDLRRALAQHSFAVAGKMLRLRALVGGCALAHGNGGAEDVIDLAERAALHARGSDQGVQLHQPPREVEAVHDGALEALLRQALAQGGFKLHFQPIVAVQGGEEAQFQSLLRLRAEDGKVHTAAELVPLAQRLGLIGEVDRWVLREAVAVLARHRDEPHPLRLFVNQSAPFSTAAGQADWLLKLLAEHDLPGSALVIDIRLDDAILDLPCVEAYCTALVPAGVQFCLSQLEGGPDGATLVERLPLGYVKLAPKYLRANTTQSLRDELRVLIDSAHRRGLKVIGHRVEDPQSAATLWMSGIDFLQGNLVQQAGSELAFDFQSAVL